MLLHRSDLNISENVRQFFPHFPANFAKFVIFAQILMKFYRNFADILENVEIFGNFEFSSENNRKIPEF